MGSVLWMGVGLGLARNIVQRYALDTGSRQGFGICEKSPINVSPGGPGKLDLDDRLKPTHWLAHFRYYMVS